MLGCFQSHSASNHTRACCVSAHVMWVQDTVGVTVTDAWGQPSSLASITVHSSPLDATSKDQAERSSQTLQQGSSSGEYLYSTAHLHSHPGTYSYDPCLPLYTWPNRCSFWLCCSELCCYVVLESSCALCLALANKKLSTGPLKDFTCTH